MGYEYVPESWRKKFKKGQTVWYLDHIGYEVVQSEFISYCEHDRECEDTVYLKDEYGSRKEILEDWTFTNLELANKCLKKYVATEAEAFERKASRLRGILKKTNKQK